MTDSSQTTKLTVQLFWHHATRYKRYLIPLLTFVPLAVVLMYFIEPYIISLVLQKISQGDYNPHDLWGSFGGYIVVYAVLTLISGVLGWRLNVWLVWQLEVRVLRDIAQRVFNHLVEMSTSFHANRFAGSLVSQANKLTGAYIRFADATVFNLLTLAASLVATVVILTPRVPIYVVVLITLATVFIIGTTYFSRAVRRANTVEAEIQSKQTGYLADSITNLMAVKSFAGSSHEKRRYHRVVTETMDAGLASMRATTVRETYSSVVTSSISIAALIIAVIGAGKLHINIATLFLIVTYTGTLGQELWEFQNVLRQYNRAFGDASDMVKILQIEPEIKDPAKPRRARISRGDILFSDVTFTYEQGLRPLFKDLNLHFKAGEKVGLVGHSGSGKTSLSKLLMRFNDIDGGAITIDGQDIRSLRQDDLHSHIAYVPQEPLLFHRSLSENISYGRPGAPLREIKAIARLANAHDFITDLPEGYKTLVGERGVKLSGGQRQRVAIARAMLKNAPILVLDEATSALDSESEVLIQDALWKLMEGRTAIVIAHRLSTIQKMDRIIVLDNGKIVEEGSHKELLARNGTYARLWQHQSGGFIED